MRYAKRLSTIALLILAIFTNQAMMCSGGGFDTQTFRLLMLAAPPIVEQLPLPASLKTGLVTDFTDIAGNVADLADCLKAGENRPADLVCIQTLEAKTEVIIARGHFGQANNEKLQRILGLIRGIIASAKIYYGGVGSSLTGRPMSRDDAEADVKAKLAELKKEMNVK